MKQSFFLPILIFFSITLVVFNLFIPGERFSMLAESFLQGKTHFLSQPKDFGWADAVLWNGQYYWPSGVFPAVLLVPFVFLFNFFGILFLHGYLQPFLVFGVFWLVWKSSLLLKYSKSDALFAAFGFVFSTVFLDPALWPEAWGFAQVVTVLCLWLSIYAYLKKSSWLLIGTFLGFAVSSRLPTLGISVFYLLAILFEKKSFQQKVKHALLFLTPIALGLAVTALYNYLRFGSVFESGYVGQLLTVPSIEESRKYGIFSIVHVPANLYYFFLSGPLPVFRDSVSHVLTFPFIAANPYGMSVFVTSPIFLYFFTFSFKDRLSKALLFSCSLVALSLFFYYGIGGRQFGYRYALDFMPFLYLLLLQKYREKNEVLSGKFKWILILSSFANLYFMISAFTAV